jgi:hypothetical protein
MSITKWASTVRREIRSVNMVCTSLTVELVLHTRTRCSRDVHYYRWDGVHVYKPGAKLIFESVASQLLQIPVKK